MRECTPRTTFALKICDFQLELRAARAAADQAGIAPATARHRRAAAQTTRQLPKTNSQAKNTQKKGTTPEDYVCYFYVVPHASQTSGFHCVEKEVLQLLLQAELRIILVTAPVRAVWLPITRRSQSVCAARSRRLPLASAWRLRKLRGTRAGPCWPSAPVLAPTPICQKKEHDLPDKKTSITVRSSFTHARTDPQEAQTQTHTHTHAHTHTHTHTHTNQQKNATARTHARTYARNSCLGTCPARKLLCTSALCNLLCLFAQSAPCKLLCASYAAEVALQVALRKLLCASCSPGNNQHSKTNTSTTLQISILACGLACGHSFSTTAAARSAWVTLLPATHWRTSSRRASARSWGWALAAVSCCSHALPCWAAPA